MAILAKVYDFWKKRSKKEKLFFCIAALFLLLTIIDFGIIQPISYKLTSLNKEIQEKKIAVRNALHILSQEKRIIKEKEIYDKYFSGAKSEDEEILSILKEIGRLAEKTSVYLQEVQPRGLTQEQPFSKYKVNISCEGQMSQITSFIYELENSSKLMRIEDFNLAPKSPNSSVAVCRMTVSRVVIP